MKKLVGFLAGLLAVMLIAFCGCSTDRIPERPEDTNLEFWIAEDVKDVDWKGYYHIPGFGADRYWSPGYEPNIDEATGDEKEPEIGVRYEVTAWPDYADGGAYITNIKITDPKVTVYGLTINSTFEEFDAVFEGLEYKITPHKYRDGYVAHYASIKGFSFSVHDLDGTKSFVISASVSNRKGIVF